MDAFGVWKEDELPLHSKSLMHLCDLLSGTNIRLVIVGGAGSLYVNKERTIQVSDSADFPAEFLPLAKAQGKALEELRDRKEFLKEITLYDVSDLTRNLCYGGLRLPEQNSSLSRSPLSADFLHHSTVSAFG